MGLFYNKQNQIIAQQYLKIIQDCTKIVNSTKNPDTYFERWALLENKIDKLIELKGIRYTGDSPKQMKLQIISKKRQNIHDMIKRYYDDTVKKADKVKTPNAKRNKFHSFISTLETYYSLMDDEHIQYINKLYNNAIKNLNE